MKTLYGILIASLCLIGVGYAEVPQINLTLEQAEIDALAYSPQIKSTQQEWEAAQAKAFSQFSLFWPRISLEGSFTYLTEVPTISLPIPGPAQEIPMGDNSNYSIGALAVWNIWDSLAVFSTWQAMQKAAAAKAAEVKAIQQEVRFKTRLAYFQTQLALKKLVLVSDALKLAEAQYRDICVQAQAGTSTRIDTLSSHLEVLARQQQFREARMELAISLRDLLSLLGKEKEWDLSMPWGSQQVNALPTQAAPPTVLLSLDPLELSQKRLAAAASKVLDLNHPRVKTIAALAESARLAAAGIAAGHWPKVMVTARSSWDYPNGPILEAVHQNMVGVKASWLLFAGNRVVNQVREQEKQALARVRMLEQVQAELNLSWQKAHDRLRNLEEAQKINQKTVTETQELARLIYKAYQTGRVNYLEVQAANLRALEASTQSALTQVQILIQLAMLDSISIAEKESK